MLQVMRHLLSHFVISESLHFQQKFKTCKLQQVLSHCNSVTYLLKVLIMEVLHMVCTYSRRDDGTAKAWMHGGMTERRKMTPNLLTLRIFFAYFFFYLYRQLSCVSPSGQLQAIVRKVPSNKGKEDIKQFLEVYDFLVVIFSI